MNDFVGKHWNSLIKPLGLELDRDSATDSYGKFIARPLERGYGLTLGNSLRRVLLSSLQGAGIVAVNIEGVDHEFGTLDNIKEEVSEIILNLKEVRFRLEDRDETTLILKRDQEGAVLASHIEESANVKILNPDHVIANISSGGNLEIHLKIARGKGYVTAQDNKDTFDLPVGWIYLDTLFSPVQRVNYTVTNARVGKRTDYDRLALEVWTNADIYPEDAVAYSAKILKDQLNIFLNFKDDDENRQTNVTSSQDTPLADALMRPVSDLELSVRSANCLLNADINTIYELVSKTEGEMLRTKNFGRKSLNEIKEILTRMGLRLGMKVDHIVKNSATSQEN